jgi:hypothetical protein
MSATTTGFDHPAIDALNAIDAGLGALLDAPLWSLPTGELGPLLVRAERLARRLDAARVVLTNQADVTGLAEREGATSLQAWLRAVADVPITDTKHRLRLHHALGSRPATKAAFHTGTISITGATAITDAITALPPAVPAAMHDEVEALLVETAADEGTHAVAARAAEIIHRFAPDALEDRENRQRQANALTLTQRHDGSLGLRGHLDTEHAALALAVLGAHAAPRPATDGTPDTRDAPTRYAHALIDVLHLASATSPTSRGEPPHIAVTISLAALQAGLHNTAGTAPGLLHTGTPISAGTARRLACDARLIPIVLGTNSEPLDIGRASRTWPAPIRRAIEARDHGCTMPGCDRPPTWSDIHHLIHWVDGGPTTVDNGTLLCRRHHTLVHHHSWTITMINNQPHAIPPTWLDHTQTPRLHSRFKTRQLQP